MLFVVVLDLEDFEQAEVLVFAVAVHNKFIRVRVNK